MKTKRFCELIELAISEEYGEESKFDVVPYLLPNGDRDTKACLGVFLSEDVHMGVIASRAMHILWTDFMRDKETAADDQIEDIDQAMTEFVEIMNAMRIAPYMQWHCAYFPGLTDAQVLAESEAFDEPRIEDPPTDETVMTAEQLMAELANVGADTLWWTMLQGNGSTKTFVAVRGNHYVTMGYLSTVRERANEATQVALNLFETMDVDVDHITFFPNFLKLTGDGSFVPN